MAISIPLSKLIFVKKLAFKLKPLYGRSIERLFFMMLSQWDCLLKNIGKWEGSFTEFSPNGDKLKDTPTIVSLAGLNDNKTMRQIIRFNYSDRAAEEKVLEYSSLGRGVLFFENGAFSQGSLQWGPFAEFGAELSLIFGCERLRMVQFFNKESKFDRLTLIRETLAGNNPTQRPLLTAEQLLGTWQGKAITIYPDLRTPDFVSSKLYLTLESNNQLAQELTFNVGNKSRTISSVANINGSILEFKNSEPARKIIMLPGGSSCNIPLEIKPGKSILLEMGWLISPNKRQRIIRNYDAKGGFINLTLVEEEKIN